MPEPAAKLGTGYDLAFSPDGRFLATMPSTSPVRVFRVGDWQRIATLDGLRYPRFTAFLNDSRLAFVASIHSSMATFEIPTGKLIRKWRTPHGELGALVITPDEEHVLVSEAYGDMLLYCLATGELVDRIELENGLFCLIDAAKFSPNGKYLSILWRTSDSGGRRTMLTILSWPKRQTVRMLQIDRGARACPIRVGKEATCFYMSSGGDGIFGARGISKLTAGRGSFVPLPLDLPESLDDFCFRFSSCGMWLLLWYDNIVRLCHATDTLEIAQLST